MIKRFLGIDFGEVRIGIAVTDPLGIFAYPLVTLSNDKNLFAELRKIIEEYNIAKIILGLPVKENNEKTIITEKTEKFKEKLEQEFQISVEFIDERYSSSIALERIQQSVKSKKKRQNKGLIDQNAAAVILQDFLDGK